MNEQQQLELESHIPRLRRYAHALVKQSHLAEDLVQDCLERAWAKRLSWRQGSDMRAWLFTIMHNLFVDGLRRKKFVTQSLEVSELPPASTDSTMLAELGDMQRCYSSMSPEYQEIILLAGVEQLSYKHIAEVLNIPQGTVMSRLSRAREELRLLMEGKKGRKLVRVK